MDEVSCLHQDVSSSADTQDDVPFDPLPRGTHSTPPGQGPATASTTSVTEETAASTAPVAAAAASSDLYRQTAHDFLRRALADLNEEHVMLSFSDVPPDLIEKHSGRILAPTAGAGLLDQEAVERIDKATQVVMGVCVLDDDGIDEDKLRKILEQLGAIDSLTVFVVLLLPSGAELDEECVDRFMKFHDDLLDMGVDDVLVNPDMEPGFLCRAVRLMRESHKSHTLRAAAALDSEPLRLSPEKMEELNNHYQNLLWNSIPLALMPHFPVCNDSISVDSKHVGDYRFYGKFETISGRVLVAAAPDDRPVAVKAIRKSDVQKPHELEEIYRESRFLSLVIQHPNIVKCIDLLHTTKTLYMVLEYVGNENLANHCEQCPGLRLDAHQALHCFKQVVSALGWMHSKQVVHRSVSLEHVVVDQRDRDGLHCTLVDFRTALVSHGDTVSNFQCGSLPCIAPEVATGVEYIPRFVDSWSVGVLLLEIAGGIRSVHLSACPNLGEDSPLAVQAIARFFRTRNCHAKALSRMGGVTCPEILAHLKRLVLVPQRSRMFLPDLDAELQNP